jgi:ribosome-associated protein
VPGTPRKKATIAGPKGKKAAPKLPVEQLDRMQALITTTLDDDKAEDIVVIDLQGRASFADRMIIATGMADRQIAAMATHLHEKLHEAGFRKPLTEGAKGTDWVLIDAGDIIVHLFKADARSLYGLEKMWSAELDEASEG